MDCRTDDCPDAVFVEDAVVVYGRTAVITNPGADERKPETPAVERAVRDLGYDVKTIPEPTTWALIAIGGGMIGWAMRRRLAGE